MIVQFVLHRLPTTVLLVLGVLPRADCPNFKWWGASLHCRSGRPRGTLPGPFTATATELNAGLRRACAAWPRVHFRDCGAQLIGANGTRIPRRLLSDQIHPTADGYRALARQCLWPMLKELRLL